MSNSTSEKEFIRLISGHQGIIHKICRTYCRHPEDHQDLFQEILLQLWRSYGSFRHEAKLSTWMYQVGLNTAISGLRKSKNQKPAASLDEHLHEFPEQRDVSEAEEERIQVLYQAISLLSDVEKALIMLYLEEHSYDDISQIMGITKTNVGVKLTRVKQKLQQLLNPVK